MFAPLLAALLAAQPPAAPAAGTVDPAPPVAPSTPAPPPAARPGVVRVALQTARGAVVIEVEKERAPVTAANFLRYVDGHRLDGQSLYRVVNVGPGYGLVQGGVRDGAKLLPPIAHEPTTRTGLSHTDGAVAMARRAPGTAQGDFFVVVGNLPSMDADPTKPGDNQGFAVFGRVVEGMDVVRGVLALPTSPTAGPPGMKGQMLEQPVRILSAKRVP